MPSSTKSPAFVHPKNIDERLSPAEESLCLLREFMDRHGALGLSLLKAGGSAALGTLMIGPVGAVAAPMAVTFLTDHCGRSLLDYLKRSRSDREKTRIAGFLTVTIQEIERRLGNGEAPRKDRLLIGNEVSWSDAESLLEGVLQSAEAAYEEKKLYYLGCLYSSFIFYSNASAEVANHAVYLSRQMTYSQYVLLSIFGQCRLAKVALDQKSTSPDLLSLIAQIVDLDQKRLIDHDPDSDLWGGGTTVLAHNNLSGLGTMLYESMHLADVKERDPVSYNSILSTLQKAEP